MGVKVKQLASKRSAIAATQKPAKAKKIVQSKPAKKAAKPKKSATVAPKKKVTALTVDPKRQAKAIEIDGRMAVAVTTMISGSKSAVEIAREMEKGDHWKDLPEKFTSFTAWMNKYAEQAHVSIRTLKGGISFAKATPQLTAAQRKNIGPRKGAKITAAAKAAEAKGQTLDPEILEKAESRTEAEVEEDLIARGLKQRPEPEHMHDDGMARFNDGVLGDEPEPETVEAHAGAFHSEYIPKRDNEDLLPPEAMNLSRDMLEDVQAGNQPGSVPHATPEPAEVSDDYSVQLPREGTSLEAVNAVQTIYPELNLGDANAIEWILADWLKTQCRDDVRFPDQTNGQAADSLKPKKNGKRKK